MLVDLLLTCLYTLPARHAWTVPAPGVAAIAPMPDEAGALSVGPDGTLRHLHPDQGGVMTLSTLCDDLRGIDTFGAGCLVAVDGKTASIVVSTPDGATLFGGVGNTLTSMRTPNDIATNGERIAVADTGNRRVLLLDMHGANLGLYDTVDGAPLQLPTAVAMAPDGTVFIADEATHQVHAIDEDGAHRWTIGGWGRAPGRFAEPSGLDEMDGTLLVADRLNHRIQAIDTATGTPIDWWGMHAVKPREGKGRIHYPEDVAFTMDGCVVAEPFENRVQGFAPGTPDRAPARTRADQSQSHFGPRMAMHGRVLVLWEPELRALQVLDLSRDVPVHTATFGTHGDGPGCLEHPIAFAFDRDDDQLVLSVTDASDGRTHAWGLNMPPQDQPGFYPDMAKLLQASPADPAVPTRRPLHRQAAFPDGRQVELRHDATVQIKDAEGRQLASFGGPGTDHGRFWNPTEIDVDQRGRIVVLDYGNHRLQAFDGDGKWLMTFGTGRAYTPRNTPSMRKDTP